METGVRITSIDGHDISKLQFEDVGKMIEDLKSKKQSLVFSVFSPILFEYSDRSGSFYGARRVDSMTPLSTDSGEYCCIELIWGQCHKSIKICLAIIKLSPYALVDLSVKD